MAAFIVDSGEDGKEAFVVAAAPAGRHGFGTIGAAQPTWAVEQGWRMVQRAGLARLAVRESGRVRTDHMSTVSWVEFRLKDEAWQMIVEHKIPPQKFRDVVWFGWGGVS